MYPTAFAKEKVYALIDMASQENIDYVIEYLEKSTSQKNEKDLERISRGLDFINKYAGSVNRDIDYKKELLESMDARYARAD